MQPALLELYFFYINKNILHIFNLSTELNNRIQVASKSYKYQQIKNKVISVLKQELTQVIKAANTSKFFNMKNLQT